MGDAHVRKSLIPDEPPAQGSGKSSGKSTSKSKSKSGSDAADNSGRVRVIAMTAVFALLLGWVAYKYAWADRAPEYVPPGDIAPPADPNQPPKPPDNTPIPPEMRIDRPDVIQG